MVKKNAELCIMLRADGRQSRDGPSVMTRLIWFKYGFDHNLSFEIQLEAQFEVLES